MRTSRKPYSFTIGPLSCAHRCFPVRSESARPGNGYGRCAHGKGHSMLPPQRPGQSRPLRWGSSIATQKDGNALVGETAPEVLSPPDFAMGAHARASGTSPRPNLACCGHRQGARGSPGNSLLHPSRTSGSQHRPTHHPSSDACITRKRADPPLAVRLPNLSRA